MLTKIKKCNMCHAELTVSDEARVVECPICSCINGYGYSRSNQIDMYAKEPPSNKNTGLQQQQQISAAPPQRQAPLHVLLGGAAQPGSLHFVDTNKLFQQFPQASPEHSPHLAKTNSFLQQPPLVSPSSQVSIRMLKTNFTSFQQLSQKPLSLQTSLPHVKTKSTFQLPSQTSSPPIPEKINNFFQQPQQTSSPKGSPRSSYNNISYQQPFQTSSLGQDEVSDYWQQQKTPTPQGSPRPSHTNISYQQPFQTSLPPGQDKVNEFSWQPQNTPSPQGSPTNSFYQQPLRTVSPLIPERINTFSQLPQQTSSPQWSPRPAYGNTSYQQPLQTSPPLIQEKTENISHLSPQTSSPQGSPRLANSNTYYQPALQSSPPLIQEKSNSLSEIPQQTSSPKGSRHSSYQQPIQSSPVESPHQPQTSSPQGSSPRPSRFSSFFKPHAAQTPSPPQDSSPLAHSDEYNKKPLQPSSQISSPPSREANNGYSQISVPPSREANNGYSQKPLLASPHMSSPKVQPLVQAPRLPVNNNGQNYQKSLPDTRPVPSSIMSTPPVTGEQHVRYGTNEGTSGKFATTNSLSADHQNSRNTEASRGNLTSAPTSYINKTEADADDDPNYIKRRLKEFREQLQI